MARIVKILGAVNHDTYCVVEVLLDNDEEASVFVGGDCEHWYDEKLGKNKAIIKRKKDVA